MIKNKIYNAFRLEELDPAQLQTGDRILYANEYDNAIKVTIVQQILDNLIYTFQWIEMETDFDKEDNRYYLEPSKSNVEVYLVINGKLNLMIESNDSHSSLGLFDIGYYPEESDQLEIPERIHKTIYSTESLPDCITAALSHPDNPINFIAYKFNESDYAVFVKEYSLSPSIRIMSCHHDSFILRKDGTTYGFGHNEVYSDFKSEIEKNHKKLLQEFESVHEQMEYPTEDLLIDVSKRTKMKEMFVGNESSVDEVLLPFYENKEKQLAVYANIHQMGTVGSIIYKDGKPVDDDENLDLEKRKAMAVLSFIRRAKSGISPFDGLHYDDGKVIKDPTGLLRSYRGIYMDGSRFGLKNKIQIDGLYLDVDEKNPEEIEYVEIIKQEYKLAKRLVN